MPGTRFAKRYGINYQTFASWVQKRRRGRGEYEKPAAVGEPEPATPALTLAEVFVEAPSPEPGDGTRDGGLRVELPGGVMLEIGDAHGAALAAELIRALAPTTAR
jgi:transposase-like protein